MPSFESYSLRNKLNSKHFNQNSSIIYNKLDLYSPEVDTAFLIPGSNEIAIKETSSGYKISPKEQNDKYSVIKINANSKDKSIRNKPLTHKPIFFPNLYTLSKVFDIPNNIMNNDIPKMGIHLTDKNGDTYFVKKLEIYCNRIIDVTEEPIIYVKDTYEYRVDSVEPGILKFYMFVDIESSRFVGDIVRYFDRLPKYGLNLILVLYLQDDIDVNSCREVVYASVKNTEDRDKAIYINFVDFNLKNIFHNIHLNNDVLIAPNVPYVGKQIGGIRSWILDSIIHRNGVLSNNGGYVDYIRADHFKVDLSSEENIISKDLFDKMNEYAKFGKAFYDKNSRSFFDELQYDYTLKKYGYLNKEVREYEKY